MEVKIDQIKPNEYNPKVTEENLTKYQSIIDGIKEMGMKSPIDVREIEGPIPYEIIDGYHRWKACKELGWTDIPIVSWGKISDDQAKKITILKEKARIPLDLIKTSVLLNELARDTSLDNLAKQVGYSFEELKSDMQLANFKWDEYKTRGVDGKELVSANLKTLNIVVTEEQYNIIQQAMEKVRKEAGATQVTDGRVIELICADYLVGK
jgi:ParB/RepB/Spo0J family partition protein